MKNKKRKGFTLVELLVVIAILAILATVSVVGYVGFTARANESNAQTEAKQAETVITAGLYDGALVAYEVDEKAEGNDISLQYNPTDKELAVDKLNTTTLTIDAALKAIYSDLVGLGVFSVKEGKLVYTSAAGIEVEMDITITGDYTA